MGTLLLFERTPTHTRTYRAFHYYSQISKQTNKANRSDHLPPSCLPAQSTSKTCTFIILDEVFADELRACLLSAPSTSTPSASAVASEGTGVVESTKVAPLEPEKITYA